MKSKKKKEKKTEKKMTFYFGSFFCRFFWYRSFRLNEGNFDEFLFYFLFIHSMTYSFIYLSMDWFISTILFGGKGNRGTTSRRAIYSLANHDRRIKAGPPYRWNDPSLRIDRSIDRSIDRYGRGQWWRRLGWAAPFIGHSLAVHHWTR